MAVIIKKGKGTAAGFDPTPVPGWLTFVVNKETRVQYQVMSYTKGIMMLKSSTGHVFSSKFKKGLTDMQYDVVSVRDPYYVPKHKIAKPSPYKSVADHVQEEEKAPQG